MIVHIHFRFGLLYFIVHGLSDLRLRIQLVLLFVIMLTLLSYNVGLLGIQLKGEKYLNPHGSFSFFTYVLAGVDM